MEWRNIKGYECLYEVSDSGLIKSLQRGERLLKLTKTNKNGYFKVDLYNRGKNKQLLVHRIVAEAFIPNPNNLPVVNHKDENKLNNSVDNLEWVTYKDNTNYGTATQRRIAHTDYSKPIYAHNARINGKKVCRSVVQLTLDGLLIKIYESAAEAFRTTNVRHITECCTGQRKSAGGYLWKYFERSVDLSVSL